MKGRCVICNTVGKLTSDHVPPQGVVPPQYVEVSRLLPLATDTEVRHERARRQYPSPQFPTLCSTCNGKLLGSEYDPELIRFARKFRSWVNASFKLGIKLPADCRLEIKPHRVARSVVGHLLAAEERRDRTAALSSGAISEALRDYFMDPLAEFPSGAGIYVWPYPSDEIVIVRWFGIANPSRHGVIIGHVLKFFPLAFWLVTSTEDEMEFPFAKLSLDNTQTVDTVVTINIPLNLVPPPTWPELPRSEEIILTGRERTFVGRPSSH
jgi:hypothetical protein